ncbi:GIN domain-containing protein [Pedobacter yulinensis]|nr:DUF2807 domain-containing protein [Pedobacter yulinensis]
MKTSFKTLFAVAMSAILCTSGAFAASATTVHPLNIGKANHPNGVRKIIAEGNVEIIVVQGKTEAVRYLGEANCRARITQRGDALRIVSNETEPERIEVSVKDIYRIEASGKAKIITRDELKMQFLQIILKDDAQADVSANVEGLYTLLQNKSALKLRGFAGDHSLNMGRVASITMDKFNSLRSSVYPLPLENEKVAAR